MKFSALFAFAAVTFFSASAAPLTERSLLIARVDPSLVPDFGVSPGVNPSGTGNCDGINGPNGAPILIPCSCPPDRQTFINSLNANVASENDVNNPAIAAPFPTDSSVGSQIVRLQTSISTLQNLNGPGVGCPAASTTFSAQLSALLG